MGAQRLGRRVQIGNILVIIRLSGIVISTKIQGKSIDPGGLRVLNVMLKSLN